MTNSIKEVWATVSEFNHLLEVSNLGNVRTLDREIRTHNQSGEFTYIKKSMVLKPSLHKKTGYYEVRMVVDGTLVRRYLHRIVLSTFGTVDPNRPYVNHKDKNTSNNTINNLEWMTASENQYHAYRMGRRNRNGKFIISDNLHKVNV